MNTKNKFLFILWIMVAILIAYRTYPKKPPPIPDTPHTFVASDGRLWAYRENISTVRSYTKENWCVIYVDGKQFAIDKPHMDVWNERWESKEPWLIFKLYNNGVDPCDFSTASSASSTKEK